MAPHVSATLVTPTVAEVLVVTTATGTTRKDNDNSSGSNTTTTSGTNNCCDSNECPLGRLSCPADRGVTLLEESSTSHSSNKCGSNCSTGSSSSRRIRGTATPSVSKGTSRYTGRLSSKEVVLLLCLLSLNSGARCIQVREVVVPRVAKTGTTVELECRYEEEGDRLYSLKWWRGDDQFYQYIPPNRSFFPARGINVNLPRTIEKNRLGSVGLERVVLEGVSLDTGGVYKCEVMADSNFQTVFKQTNMTVIHPPAGPPRLTAPMMDTVRIGQHLSLNCSVPPSNPPASIRWFINGHHAPQEWVYPEPTHYSQDLIHIGSGLRFQVMPSHLPRSRGVLAIRCEGRQMGPDSISYEESREVSYRSHSRSSLWNLFSSGGRPESGLHLLVSVLCCLLLLPRLLLLPCSFASCW